MSSAELGSTKALIVDDCLTERSIYARMLSNIGIESLVADNGLAAMDILAEDDSISLMLVDWNMPLLDGLSLTQNIRAQNKFNQTKIIMITSRSELVDIEGALQAGVDEYIMKPITNEALKEKLTLLNIPK